MKRRNSPIPLPAAVLIVAVAVALALMVWTLAGADDDTTRLSLPECDPGAVCQPYPPPYPGPYPAPPQPDAAFLPFVAEESYP